MPSVASSAGLQRQFSACLDDAMRICSTTLEQPVALKRLESHYRSVDLNDLHLALLPVSSHSRNRGLRWLLENKARQVERLLDGGSGVVNLLLDNCSDLQSGDVGIGVSVGSIRAATPARKVHLKIAATVAAIRDSPQAYVDFCESAQVVVLVVDENEPLDNVDIRWLGSLINVFDVVWVWVATTGVEPGGAAAAATRIKAEFSTFTDAACLPVMVLSGSATEIELPLLARQASPFRDLLQLLGRLRMLDAIIASEANLRTSRYEELVARAAKLEEQQKSRKAAQRNAIDQQFEAASEFLARQIKDIEDRINTRNEQLLHAKGLLPVSLRYLVEKIRFESLDHSKADGEHCYQLTGSQLSELESSIGQQILDQLREDVFQICMELNDFLPRFFRGVRLLSGSRPDSDVTPPSEQAIWKQLQGMIHVNREEQVRIPQLTFGALLGKTRQRVFMILMFGMILGRLGLDFMKNTADWPEWLKPAMTTAGVSLLIASGVLVVVDHQKNSRKLRQIAVDKIHEAIIRDGTKVMQSVQKEKIRLLKLFLEQTHKKIERRISRLFDSAKEWQLQVQSNGAERLNSRRAVLHVELSTSKQQCEDVAKLHKKVADLTALVGKTTAELAQIEAPITICKPAESSSIAEKLIPAPANGGAESIASRRSAPDLIASRIKRRPHTNKEVAEKVPPVCNEPQRPLQSSFAERRRKRLGDDSASSSNEAN